MCRVVFVLAIVVLLSGSAQAQSPSEAQAAASSVDQQGEFDRAIENHWRFGFKASFNPWRTNRNLVKLVFPSASNIEVSGRDFEIGLVLGKHFGQEISVSYFNRSFASSSKLTVDRGATSIYFIGRVFEGPQYDVYSLSSAS
ncbi:MAG TPA: hypothetical protein VD998_01925, partial [Verrucomicrobiae bacterium]|nr:hypothetical protein [Verrucomicrobiae bacterium]